MADATQEKSWASFHRLVDKAIIKMDEISQPCTDFFLMELFQILMDNKWHPSQAPSIKHPPLDKQDYEVLAYVAGAAITRLQRRLPAGPKEVVSSMAANDDTCDLADHVQLTRDLTRGGLKMVRRETCDLMAAMELLFQEQCSMKCFQRDTYVKKCCSVQPLFLDCISEGFSDADIEKVFEAFVTFFFRCRAHHTASVLTEHISGKKTKSLRKSLKRDELCIWKMKKCTLYVKV